MMLGRIHIFLLVFASLVANIALGQNASAILDRNEILIGEQAVLSLSYSIEKGSISHVAFPIIEAELAEGLEVIRKTEIDTMATGQNVSQTRLEQKIYFTAFDSGAYEIPAFSFECKGNTEKTAALTFTVQTVEIDTTGGIYGNRDGYTVEVGWMDYLKVFLKSDTAKILGLVLLIALIVLIVVYVLRKNRKPKEESIAIVPAIPAHELALQALQKLLDDKKYQDKNVKALHTEITDALRSFLEGAFNIHAHEQTSAQIVKSLRYAGIKEKSMQNLRTIMFRADLVKFAKEKPDIRESELAIVDAIQFVNDNIPAIVKPEESAKEDE